MIIICLIIFILWYYYILPKKDFNNTKEIPKSYFITKTNRIDIQSKYECAAFSSAYVLRHLGKEVDGNELYKKYPRKLLDGTVMPKGIIRYFKRLGLKASFYTGNIDTLKRRISEGVPVIAFIKVLPEKRYLHFVPVIGYDEQNLYLAESLKYLINSNGDFYNRRITIANFEKVWKIWLPFCKNTYISLAIEGEKKDRKYYY